MAANGLFLFAVVLATLVPFSYQLYCYECADGNVTLLHSPGPDYDLFSNNSCGSFNDELLKNCSGLCISATAYKDGESGSMHGCHRMGLCETIVNEPGVTKKCSFCNVDGCNSASGIAAASILIALSFISVKFY